MIIRGVNQLTTILAFAGIIALSALFFNISPVIVGAAADNRGFSNQQLGMLMVPGMSAKVLISLLLSFWVRRINIKLLLLFGGACAFFGYIFAAFTTSFTILLIALGIAGVGTGILYCISMACLGAAKNPDRGFGFSQLFQSILMVIGLYAVPIWISPIWGLTGVFMLLAMAVVLAVALITFPVTGKQSIDIGAQHNNQAIDVKQLSPAIMAMAALFIFNLGLNGFWVFYERIATNIGYTTESIALTLSTSVGIGTLGAFLPILVYNRINRNTMIIAIGLIFILVMAGLITIFNESVFWVLSVLFQACWCAILAYMFASIAAEDRYGKIVILIPAIYSLSSLIASAVAGYVYNYGHIVFLTYTTSMVFVSIIFWAALRKRQCNT
ncbi:MAG: MFS transporter [Pseudomonadota bacterium]|nr:MFS transporter [Pseudomonadota bacterium]